MSKYSRVGHNDDLYFGDKNSKLGKSQQKVNMLHWTWKGKGWNSSHLLHSAHLWSSGCKIQGRTIYRSCQKTDFKHSSCDCLFPVPEFWTISTIQSRNVVAGKKNPFWNVKWWFPIYQLFKAWTVTKKWAGNQNAHVLITYNISASFATSLVKTKSLLLPLAEEDGKSCLWKARVNKKTVLPVKFSDLGNLYSTNAILYPHEQSQKLCKCTNNCEVIQMQAALFLFLLSK